MDETVSCAWARTNPPNSRFPTPLGFDFIRRGGLFNIGRPTFLRAVPRRDGKDVGARAVCFPRRRSRDRVCAAICCRAFLRRVEGISPKLRHGRRVIPLGPCKRAPTLGLQWLLVMYASPLAPKSCLAPMGWGRYRWLLRNIAYQTVAQASHFRKPTQTMGEKRTQFDLLRRKAYERMQ